MDPGQLDPNIFVDEDPDLKTVNSIFLDYDPDDLQRMEAASVFTDNDPDALETRQNKLIEKQYAPEKTPEEIKSMGFFERMQYAKQLEQEFKIRESKGITKGTLSGATLGLSEYVPGLEPEEDDLLFGVSEFIGSALPITRLYNFLGKPLVKLAAKSPYAKTAVNSLARMTGFGVTGSTYESAKHAIKEQEAPSIDDVVKWGAQWAALDGALQVVGKGVSFANKLRLASKNKKNLSEQKVLNNVISQLSKEKINPELNPEEYATRAEEILDELNAKEAPVEAQEQTPLESLSEKLDVSKEVEGKPQKNSKFIESENEVNGLKTKVLKSDNGHVEYTKDQDGLITIVNIESNKSPNAFINLLKELSDKNPDSTFSGSNLTEEGAKIFSKFTGKKISPNSFDPKDSIVLKPEEVKQLIKDRKSVV